MKLCYFTIKNHPKSPGKNIGRGETGNAAGPAFIRRTCVGKFIRVDDYHPYRINSGQGAGRGERTRSAGDVSDGREVIVRFPLEVS